MPSTLRDRVPPVRWKGRVAFATNPVISLRLGWLPGCLSRALGALRCSAKRVGVVGSVASLVWTVRDHPLLLGSEREREKLREG